MTFPRAWINAEPAHGLSGTTCQACGQAWPCVTERKARKLAGKVPGWTPEDEVNLRARVRRLRR